MLLRPKKTSCFRKCKWWEKASPRWPQIYFFNRFSRDILFSSLVSFVFFCILAFLLLLLLFLLLIVRCFLKCTFWYTFDLCGRVSDKKTFNQTTSGNKATFFGLTSQNIRSSVPDICGNGTSSRVGKTTLRKWTLPNPMQLSIVASYTHKKCSASVTAI